MATLNFLSGNATSSTKGMVTKTLTSISGGSAVDGQVMRFLVGGDVSSGSAGSKGHAAIVLKNKSGQRIDAFSESNLVMSAGQVKGLILRPQSLGGNVKATEPSPGAWDGFLVYDIHTTSGAGPEYTVDFMVSGKLVGLDSYVDIQEAGSETNPRQFPLLNEAYGGNGVYQLSIALEFTTGL